MKKPARFKKGDKVAIVSLSSGKLGEAFISHNLKIGIKRLKAFGLEPIFMPNTLKGIDYLKRKPEKRAEDLCLAFENPTIKGIICAIGGDDTYRTLPFLMENQAFISAVNRHPKLFTGFSDTTINHFMFYQLGMVSYYGPAFIPDLAEISNNMLPYTHKYFSYYLDPSEKFEGIYPSDRWYEERTDFSAKSLGTERISHLDSRGFELAQGVANFEGVLLGGCIESLFDMLIPDTYESMPKIIADYRIFPTLAEWEGKILFLETSENKANPQKFKRMLITLKEFGLFNVIKGIIVGKPQDEAFYEEYKKILIEVVADPSLPIVCNINFGHALPRCVLPIGIKVQVDNTIKQAIVFLEAPFENE